MPAPFSDFDKSNPITASWANAVDAVASIIRIGIGSPEGVISAGVGTIFLRTDGGASTTLYVKESGSGNTGWVGK